MAKIGREKWWVLISIGTGSFMAALDGSIVNTVLPVIRVDFRSEISVIQWVITVYLLILSGLLLTFGRLGDLRGHKKIYILGFGIFILSSALCGTAWNPSALVLCRGLQAVGGAMLASNAPAIVTGNFPVDMRGRAFGMVSTMTYMGLTVGPSLGGWLAQTIHWRAIFFVNIPIGILALILCIAFIPNDLPIEEGEKFDIPGAFVFMACLSALLLGLNKSSDWGWDSPWVLGLIAGSLILFLLFLHIERSSVSPMLDLRLFKIPLFALSTISAISNYICVYTITFLMPFYLIQGRGFEPGQAGLILTAQPIIMALAAPISGALSDKVGSRFPGMLGMTVLAGGLFSLSKLSMTTENVLIILSLAIAGFGTGTFISPNTNALMSSAPKQRQGIASGIQAAARNVGMVLGIGLAGAIFTSQIAQNAPDSFFKGIDSGFLAAAGIAVLGIVFSAAKEK